MLLSLREQQSALHQALERLTAQLGALEAAPAFMPSSTSCRPCRRRLSPARPSGTGRAAANPFGPSRTPVASRPAFDPTAEHKATAGLDLWAMRFGAVFALVSSRSWRDARLHFPSRQCARPPGPLRHHRARQRVRALHRRPLRPQLGPFHRRPPAARRRVGGTLRRVFSGQRARRHAKVPHPVLAGIILLTWTFYAIFVAERHKSHTIGIIAIATWLLQHGAGPDRLVSAWG